LRRPASAPPSRIDRAAETVEPAPPQPAPAPDAAPGLGRRVRRGLGEVVRLLREGRGRIGAPPVPAGPRPAPAVAQGAQFLSRAHAGPAGRRGYRLYVPASAPGRPRGLIVMLHGCRQDPDDFATGTGMNRVAEAHGLLVAYPGQDAAANPAACWSWFSPADQRRGAGEPAIIAGIAQQVAAEFGVDPGAVFAAGLSAGGAMAAVLAEAYPDVFAAIGVHSGLPTGAASDVVSAFAAMRDGGGRPAAPRRDAGGAAKPRVIVFHGDADATVHPANARRIVSAAAPGVATREERGVSAGGRAYARSVFADAAGAETVELWLVQGAGHAWSGGVAAGSFTDPAGPDASAEMARFFLAARR
jgi:poly(hydroxyalkanoate) depolymerase family esterase